MGGATNKAFSNESGGAEKGHAEYLKNAAGDICMTPFEALVALDRLGLVEISAALTAPGKVTVRRV